MWPPRPVACYLGKEPFCVTYADGLAHVDIPKLVAFHSRKGTPRPHQFDRVANKLQEKRKLAKVGLSPLIPTGRTEQ